MVNNGVFYFTSTFRFSQTFAAKLAGLFRPECFYEKISCHFFARSVLVAQLNRKCIPFSIGKNAPLSSEFSASTFFHFFPLGSRAWRVSSNQQKRNFVCVSFLKNRSTGFESFRFRFFKILILSEEVWLALVLALKLNRKDIRLAENSRAYITNPASALLRYTARLFYTVFWEPLSLATENFID